MKVTTLQYRIKDQTTGKHLNKMAGAVNFVWNYCNSINKERWDKFHLTYSEFDLNSMTKGCSKDLGIGSKTIQLVAKELTTRRFQYKKIKLSWRSRKRSLGWIPFYADNIRVRKDVVTYFGHKFKIWLSRPITGKILCGSFSQNSKGQWFINLSIEDTTISKVKTTNEVGIDLGLKTIVSLSTGVDLSRDNLTNKYAAKLATAQRAKKKKLVRSIHLKIANKRKDWNHKVTTTLVRDFDKIVVGDVSSSKLIKTKLAKSVLDAGWFQFKTMLKYKAITLGVEIKMVNESFSTITCSSCKDRTGPKGLSGLGVRQWICSSCGITHNRDTNAATNILLSA
jgi:putative transposase